MSTDANGVARFENIPVGSVGVRATKTDYRGANATVTVNAGGPVANHTLTLRNQHLGCRRKHLREVNATAGTNTLGPMFWADEPWILLLRDALWVILLILTIAFTVVGLLWPEPAAGGLAAAVICFGLFSYANHIVFGMIPGVTVMTLAFAAFLAVGALTVMALMTPPPLPLFDFATGTYGVAAGERHRVSGRVCAVMGFSVGLIAGRQSFNYHDWTVVIVATIIAALTAVGVFLVMFWFHDPATFLGDPPAVVGFCIAQLFAGAVAGFVAGLMGHAFINDGNLDSPTFGLTDLLLPFDGERYCVQGHRGYISHFHRRYEVEVTINTPHGRSRATRRGSTTRSSPTTSPCPVGHRSWRSRRATSSAFARTGSAT